jgi:glycosyltransferase involved in cell wall biosynthesis
VTLRVLVLTEDPAGPSVRHRWTYLAPYLADHGVELSILPVEPRAVRAEAFGAAEKADLTVIHRKLFRLFDFLRLMRRARRRIVYDVDDAVMYRPSGRRRQWSFMRGLRFGRTVRQSRLFIAGNEYLKSRAPRLVRILVQPTPIDLPRYAPREDWPDRGRVIGWIGTPATVPYLRSIGPALAELAARRKDVVLRVIGSEPVDLPGVETDLVPWSEEGEAGALRSLDVGVMPQPDDPWTRGKCAFKALQYMAAGLPVVASPVGMNVEVVADGVSGYLARTRGEWTSFLDRLLAGPTLRESCGKAGRRRVEERFASERLAPGLAKALRAAAR